MLASRSVVAVLLRALEPFLYTLKAGPAGGRPRAGSDATATGAPASPSRYVIPRTPSATVTNVPGLPDSEGTGDQAPHPGGGHEGTR
jgi:hypothetical protein